MGHREKRLEFPNLDSVEMLADYGMDAGFITDYIDAIVINNARVKDLAKLIVVITILIDAGRIDRKPVKLLADETVHLRAQGHSATPIVIDSRNCRPIRKVRRNRNE